jgi:uncharacterized protein (DUF736 family)
MIPPRHWLRTGRIEAARRGFRTKEAHMANIGSFTRDGDKFTGAISTLALKSKVIFQPITKTKPKMPDFRLYAAGAEIGAAWAKTSESERPYLSVTLDDPTFGDTIYCRLIEFEDGKHQLLWSR